MLAGRIFLKLILAVLCLLAVAMSVVDVLAARAAEFQYIQTLTEQVAGKCRLVALLSRGDFTNVHSLAKAAGARLTVVAPDGRVIADSDADPEKMENHRSRREVMEALSGKQSSTIRLSPTTGGKFLYVAVPNPAGALRLAVPLAEVDRQVLAIRNRILISTALALLPAIILAALVARRVSARLGRIIDYSGQLAQGHFHARLQDPGGDELGVLGRKLNETGEKLQKMLDELQHEHAEWEKLERIRKDFVMNVSHELRTPLASIQGYTETLLDGALDDPQNNVRFLSIIRKNAERLATLTADLMTLSRIELNTRPFRFGSHFIVAILAESVDSMRPIAEKKNVTLHLDAVPGNVEIFCDSLATLQVLCNLMDNAINYSHERGSVTVGARKLADCVEVYVRDSGIGIPVEHLPRLFERFYRVDKARSRGLGGTGLGLAIVKHLVRAQHGEIRVESEIGRGSTFFFTLPLRGTGPDESIDKVRDPQFTAS